MSSLKTIFFLGATGGCTNWALLCALKAGHTCITLVRNPKKLVRMLIDGGLRQSTLDTHLIIQEGNARDLDAIKAALTQKSVDMIVSGIGMDALAKDPDATICQDSTNMILQVLREKKVKPPHLVVISTTGITDGARDVPILLMPLYHWLLKVPHEDKKVMEKMVVDAAGEPDPPISGYTLIRPTLLIDRDEPKGLSRIHVGSDESPALGYTIPRKDVGLWIYERLIYGDVGEWMNQKPTLTAS